MLFQYYSILHVILSNIHFNILLHIGDYWFQYYLIFLSNLPDAEPSLRDSPGHRPVAVLVGRHVSDSAVSVLLRSSCRPALMGGGASLSDLSRGAAPPAGPSARRPGAGSVATVPVTTTPPRSAASESRDGGSYPHRDGRLPGSVAHHDPSRTGPGPGRPGH